MRAFVQQAVSFAKAMPYAAELLFVMSSGLVVSFYFILA